MNLMFSFGGFRRHTSFGATRACGRFSLFLPGLAGWGLCMGLIFAGIPLSAQQAPALLLTRGPYLQCGTTTKIIVRWRTQPASDSRAQFGLTASALPWEVNDAALTTEHSMTLTNLSPNTKYFYRIGSS